MKYRSTKYESLAKTEQELHDMASTAMDANEDLSSIFNGQEYKKHKEASRRFFQSELVSMLCYAITQHKTKSAKSILNHIQSQESQEVFYSELAEELFKICNENKQNAETIINFVQEHNILEHLFTNLSDERIRTELSRKDCNNKYVHDASTIVKTLRQKHVHKCIKHVYSVEDFMKIVMIASIMSWAPTICVLLTVPNNPTEEQLGRFYNILTLSCILFGLVITFALCAIIVSSISNYFSNEKCEGTLKELLTQSAIPTTEEQKNNPSSSVLGTSMVTNSGEVSF